MKLQVLNGQLTKDPLTEFCEHEISAHSANWPPDEVTLAMDFITFFHAEDCALFSQLVDLCARFSVEVSLLELPDRHSGINCCFGEKRVILISTSEIDGFSREHTLLHELREIVEYQFRELGHGIAEREELEKRAELFAALARMHVGAALWTSLVGAAANIRATLPRFGAYALLGAGAMGYLFCLFLPCLDYLRANSSQAHLDQRLVTRARHCLPAT
jgi:hypothetical protein